MKLFHALWICYSIKFLIFLKEKKRKYEAPIPTRIGKRKKKGKGPDAATKLPTGKFSISCYFKTNSTLNNW